MAFWGDYHTHTKYSHGKGYVIDNARVAAEKGLKQIAITDHGLSHIMFGIHRKELPLLRRDCENATKETGVLVLAGIENNVNSFDGTFDLRPEDLDMIDIVQGAYHKAGRAPTLKQQFTYQFANFYRSMCKSSPSSLIAKNTDSYLKLLDNYEVDFLGHLNRDIRLDVIEVARYAKQKGTYIELNGKRMSLTDKEIEKMAQEGIDFICNSDAHTPEKVGDMGLGYEAVKRLHIPYEQIGNWERFPNFRSSNYKRATGIVEASENGGDGASVND